MLHTISVLVENKFGVLARISGLFSARGFNISSLAVGETDDPTISRMTIIVDAKDEKILEQVKKQLHKLIDVIAVEDFTNRDYIERELMLIKLNKSKEAKELIGKFGLKILEEKGNFILLDVVLDNQTMKKFLEKAKPMGIKELVRTGRVAIAK